MGVVAALLGVGCGGGLEPSLPVPRPAAPPRVRPPGEPLAFGQVDRNVLQTARQLAPLVEYLENRSGIALDLAYFTEPEAEIEGLIQGNLDFAWLSPVHYVQVRRRIPIVPLVRPVMENRSTYRSVLVVRRDDPAREVGDLKGRTLAFVRPDSTSGNLFPRAFLAARGLDPDRDFRAAPYSGSHSRSLAGVADGSLDAAFVEEGVMGRATPEGAALRVLAEVASIPHGPIVAHPSVSPERVEAIRDAFAAYATDPMIANLRFGLAKAARVQSFRETRDEDYADVARLSAETGSGPGSGSGGSIGGSGGAASGGTGGRAGNGSRGSTASGAATGTGSRAGTGRGTGDGS